MKKICIIFVFCGKIIYAQPGKSFFVVHADPYEPNGVIFANLASLVNSANTYSVKLTIEFSKPWCDSIIARPTYSTQVKQWQQQGHELAVHHHDYDHAEWDGYSVISTHTPHPQSMPYIGPVSSLHNVSDLVCGDSTCLTIGSGPGNIESVNDWHSKWIYKTDGGTNDSDSYSDVTTYNFGPYTVCGLGYSYLNNGTDLTGIKNLFDPSTKTVCGVVTHVWNTVNTPSVFVGPNGWFQYISGKTPGQCKTVRQIMRENGCLLTSIKNISIDQQQIQVFPNPAKNQLSVKSIGMLYLKIYGLLGNVLQNIELKNNDEKCDIDLSEFPPGVYFIKVELRNGAIMAEKFIKE